VESSEFLEQARALSSLAAVIGWSLAQDPPAEFVDVVIQDEYTHDVVVQVTADVFLVFSTT
jgi:hypothetical protein